jgi:hypothetical protein
MPAVVDERRTTDRTIDRLAGLVEDAAVLAMVFSFMALAAAVIVAALVI